MLAGPPRLLSLVSVVFLLGLGWYYVRLLRVPSTPNLQSGASELQRDAVDFSIPLRFKDGVAKPEGEEYSHVLVVPKTMEEDIEWMHQELPDTPLVVYEVDNPNSKNKIPKNKGREAMVCP